MTQAQRDKLLENLEREAQDMVLVAENILPIARRSHPQAEAALQWESTEDVLGAAAARVRRRWGGVGSVRVLSHRDTCMVRVSRVLRRARESARSQPVPGAGPGAGRP